MTVILVSLSMSSYAQQPSAVSNPDDVWQIRWSASDEFNGDNPDWSKWIRSGNLPNTTAWKWDNSNNAVTNNGVAELTMKQNPNNASDGGTYFKSGILKSYQTFTYGYFEARIKGADIGEGVCPSFWLFSNFDYSVGNGKTVYSEIDIVELQQFDWYEGHQDDIYDMDLNLHAVVMENGSGVWRRPKQHPNEQLNKFRAPWDPTDDYHIYGAEVNEEEIIWYIDGVEVARKPNTYWHRPMNVTLSLGLRKPFVEFYNNRNNAVNPETDARAAAKLPGMPTSMFIDYVRVWEQGEVKPTCEKDLGEIGNPSFETNELGCWDSSIGIQEVVSNNTTDGTNAVRINNGNVAQIITLSANTTYTISADAKISNDGALAFLGVNDAVVDSVITTYKYSKTSYENGSITFTTGTQESIYRVWLYSSTEAYCDNFTISSGNCATVSDVTISDTNISLNEGETMQLSAQVIPSNACDKSVTWSSSNSGIVSVNNGVIVGQAEGIATITVVANDGDFSASTSVNVVNNTNNITNPGFEDNDLSDWNLEGNSSVVSSNENSGSKAGFINGNGSINQIVTLQPNTTYTLSAAVKVGSNDQSVYLGVTNNTTSTFIKNTLCSSTNYEQKTITFETASTQQEYRIWFWNNEGGAYYIDDLLLEVSETSIVNVESVTLSNTSLTLNEGESFTLSATISPSNASNKGLTWSTDNSNIATINNGVIEAIKEGTTTLTVTTNEGQKIDNCQLIVKSNNGGGGNADLPSAGSTIWLSNLSDEIVTVNTGAATALQATKSSVSALEEFNVLEVDDFFALRSVSTGKYVTIASLTNSPLRCGASGIFERQKFIFELSSDGYLLLKAKINGNYVSISSNDLEASESDVSNAEKFLWGTSSSSRFLSNEIGNVKNMKVYPNPYNHGDLYIFLEESLSGSILLMNIQGQEVFKQNFYNKQRIVLKEDVLPNLQGVMILQVVTANSITTTRIISK